MSERTFIDVEGVRTHYVERGSGPALVLLHGGNFGATTVASCLSDWGLNLDGLAQWARVVAVDRLGQGHTGNPATDEDYTMDASVRHSYQTLRALGLTDVHVVGHSRGGYVACRLTQEYPELVRSCTIVDAGTLAPGTPRNSIVHAHTPEPYLSRESQRWVLEQISYNPLSVTEEWLDELVSLAGLPAYREALDKMTTQGFDQRLFTPQLARQKAESLSWLKEWGLGRPTLLVWGFDDPAAPLDQGIALYQFLAHREKRTQMHVFNNAGHFCYREQPQAFNQLLRGFVATT